MQLRRAAAAAVLLFISVFLLPTATTAHNITRILQKYPEISTFNHYLSATNLGQEINQRETITVCVVDNAGMSDLLSKHLTLGSIRNVLSLQVLLDYYDSEKLHKLTNQTALAATMYQADGGASGTSGIVNITQLAGGKVVIFPKDNGGVNSATFVKEVEGIRYNISLIQISKLLPSSEAEAPAPAQSQVNLTDLMSAHGCKVFAETLAANPAEKTFESNVMSGLTIFCAGDEAMKNFMPKYKNLTAAGQQSLLEFHGMPIYQSLRDLRSSNGLTTTLATDGGKYTFTVQNDGTDVTIKTKLVTAKIVNTVTDKPALNLAIFELHKVLLPAELFKSSLSPSPAPAPGPEADAPSPKSSKNKHKSPPAPTPSSDSPADAPDGEVADQTSNGGGRIECGGLCAAILSLGFVFLQLRVF